MKRALACLAVALLAPPAAAQVTEHRLYNGLLLLMQRQDGLREIEVTAGYFVGHSDGALRGMAHLMEHLAMRETRDGRGLAARYPGYGVSGGAVTTGGVTLFSSAGRPGPGMLDTLLSLQRQRMTDLALSEAAITAERRSVHTETDGRPGDPWRGPLFGRHVLRFGNDHADLDRISRADLLAFYRRYYVPSNAALVVTSALPDSQVIARVTALFRAWPPAAPIPRPVFRDSSTIEARRWQGSAPRNQRVLAMLMPGPQHPLRPLLELAVQRLRAHASRSSVALRLSDEAPVSLLILSVPDSAAAARRLDDVWRELRALVDSISPAQVASAAGPSSGALLACEAAGNWRYCLPADSVARARSGLAARLSDLVGGARVLLWPTPLRPPPNPAARPVAAATEPQVWRAPEQTPISWQRARGGMEWTSRPGGFAQSVYLAAVLAPVEPSPTRSRIAALEVWARSWRSLRLPSGQLVDSLLAAQGVSASVRSLPYPTLATTDAFLMLATLPTPLGAYGVEVTLTAPRERAGAALTLLQQAFAVGTVDSASFAALKQRQLELLTANLSGPSVAAKIAMRQRLLDAPASARFAPAAPPAQLTTLADLTLAEVNEVPRVIARSGGARLAILGAEESEAGAWLESSGLANLAGLHWNAPGAACPARDTTTVDVRVGPALPQTTLFALSCYPAPANDAALIVANAVLGGSEEALLARRLRGELGFAYAFTSRLLTAWEAPLGFWVLEISTPTASVAQAIQEIRVTLAKAVAEGPTPELFQAARRIVLNARLARSSEGIPWVSNVLWRGRSPEQDFAELARVTLAEVREALKLGWPVEGIKFVRSGGGR